MEEEERLCSAGNDKILAVTYDFRFGILISFEMPNNIKGGHAIFMMVQKGSQTNDRLRTLPGGSCPCYV